MRRRRLRRHRHDSRARPSARRCSSSCAPSPGTTAGGRPAQAARPTIEQLLARVERRHRARECEVIAATARAQRRDPHLGRGRRSPTRTRSCVDSETRPPDGHRRPHPARRRHRAGRRRRAWPPDGEVVLTSDDVAAACKTLPRTMAVVGGGVIGIEYASMFAALGVQVTLVEKRERVARVPRSRDRRRADPPDARPERHLPPGEAVERLEVDRRAAAAGGAAPGVGQAHRRRTWCSSPPAASAPPRRSNLAAAGLDGRRPRAAEGRRDVPHRGAAHLRRRRRDRLPEPRRDLERAGPAGRLPRVRRRRPARWRSTSPSASTRSRRSRWSARPSTS